ncbi:MAG: hypothetical protein EOO38_31285 [Cytophagaceae bacterium]|nr:MAG: hypothetical protein EOO38_31285 [Cytophagaceae bacterium]
MPSGVGHVRHIRPEAIDFGIEEILHAVYHVSELLLPVPGCTGTCGQCSLIADFARTTACYLFNRLAHQNPIDQIKDDLDYVAKTGGRIRTAGPDSCVGPWSIHDVEDRLLMPLVRTDAKNLAEQLTVQEAQVGAGIRISAERNY